MTSAGFCFFFGGLQLWVVGCLVFGLFVLGLLCFLAGGVWERGPLGQTGPEKWVGHFPRRQRGYVWDRRCGSVLGFQRGGGTPALSLCWRGG